MNWKILIFFCLVFIALGFFIGQSCNTNSTLESIDKKLSESEERFDDIQKEIESLSDSITALAIERNETKNYYTYETYKIDSLIQFDSSMVNAIIRARLERLYQLPGFFFIPNDTGRTQLDSKGASSW